MLQLTALFYKDDLAGNPLFIQVVKASSFSKLCELNFFLNFVR